MPEERFLYLCRWFENRDCKIMTNKVSRAGNNKGWYSRVEEAQNLDAAMLLLFSKVKFPHRPTHPPTHRRRHPPSTTTFLPLLSKASASVIGFHCLRNNGDRVFCLVATGESSERARTWNAARARTRSPRSQRTIPTAARDGADTQTNVRLADGKGRKKKNSKQCRSGRDINI